MNRRNVYIRRMLTIPALLTALLMAGTALGQFEITRFTIDGGGGTSSGGDFDLSGTSGQPDAGSMSGGGFEINGGFWTPVEGARLSGVNGNGNGLIDGRGIQNFTDRLIGIGTICQCADRLTNGVLDMNDVADFVNDLLTGATRVP
ncbi:MAG: hypothetical protein MI923_25975 [Phycisphaerales bacterium]|nr:hypothetical protein [Phycisphaerales bacterium]